MNEAVRAGGGGDGAFGAEVSWWTTVESELRRRNDLDRSRGSGVVSADCRPSRTSVSLISISVDRSRTVSTASALESSLTASIDAPPPADAAVGDGVDVRDGSVGCGIAEGLGGGGGDTKNCALEAADSGMADGGGDCAIAAVSSDGVWSNSAPRANGVTLEAASVVVTTEAAVANGSPSVNVEYLRLCGPLIPDRPRGVPPPAAGLDSPDEPLGAAGMDDDAGLAGRLLLLLPLDVAVSPPMVLMVMFSSCLRKLLNVRMSGVTATAWVVAAVVLDAENSCCSVVLLPLVLLSSPESCAPGDGGHLTASFTWKI